MSGPADNVLRVRTPEGVVFPFRLATPVSRLVAWAVDKAAIMVAWAVVSALIRLLGMISADTAQGLMVIGYFAVSTGYAIVLEWVWNGQTLGKRVMHLRVMDERGLPLQFSQVVVRNLLRAVDALPVAYLVGGLTAFATRKAQRLGDVAAATIVVHDAPAGEAGLGGFEPAKYNSLRSHRHIAARLRAGTSAALAQAALQALGRRERLEPAARLALFRELADGFRRIGHLPPELEEGLADEALVRNVVEVLFVPVSRRPAAEAPREEPAAP